MEYVAGIPIITGVIEAIKRAGMPAQFSPLVAIILGIGYGFGVLQTFSFDAFLYGLMAGLAAIGVYEGAKTGVIETKKILK